MTIRIVVASHHPIVLLGLERVFSLERDCAVVGAASTGDEALRAVSQHLPDVLVLDLAIPGRDALAVLTELRSTKLRREAISTRTIVLSATNGADLVEAIRLGARGTLLKDRASASLVDCVRTVHGGGKWFDKWFAPATVAALPQNGQDIRAIPETLTPREVQIARLLADGMPTKTIADRLAISEGTARLHLHHVYQKLRVNGRVGLLRYMRNQPLD